MADGLPADFGPSIRSGSGNWFRALQSLGSGKNAAVSLVVATSGTFQGLPFALKVFTRLSSVASSERFLREAAFLRECDHPAIMRIVDVGIYRAKFPFILLYYLPPTLRAAISPTLPSV